MSDRRSFLSKRDQTDDDYRAAARIEYNKTAPTPDDTAPFDVAAFLSYLNNGYTEEAAASAASVYAGAAASDFYRDLRTHYYGDECPGGHYADHEGPRDVPDNYWPDDDNYYGCPHHNDDGASTHFHNCND